MNPEFTNILPDFSIANLRDIENMRIGFKVPMMKKLISSGKILPIKIGSKLHISRDEIIRYLTENSKN